jgi:hypothetical protein
MGRKYSEDEINKHEHSESLRFLDIVLYFTDHSLSIFWKLIELLYIEYISLASIAVMSYRYWCFSYSRIDGDACGNVIVPT